VKTKSFILITILLFAYSCKKQPDITLSPFIDIKFENIPGSTVESGSQDSVFAKYFVSPLSISILEYHLEKFKLKNPDIEQRIFAFQVTTSEDSEVFIKGKNVIAMSGGMGFDKSYYVRQIRNKFAIPVRFSDRVIKNNYTIEHRKENGYIKVQYRSGYSGRIVRKILIIN
jgi:endoglucanase Acf2